MFDHDLDRRLDRIIDLQERQTDLLQRILAALTKQSDVRSLKVSFDKPTNQREETKMPVAKLGVAAPQPMLDDQKTTMHVAPLAADGSASAFPTGSTSATNPAYVADDPSSVTLTPAADGLSCACVGVKGKAGTPTITATYTNPDGSKASGSGQLTITIDPAELDVSSLGVSFDPPVAQ